MGAETGILWTDHTFNPWHGCQRVSPGCENCYAETFNKFRHGGSGPHWGPLAPRRFFGDKHWNEPLKWDRDAETAGVRRRVFCASMADVFEDRRDLDEQRDRLWALISATPQLDWQLLTKRPENIEKMLPPDWGTGWANVWLGTTAEDQQRADDRIPHLLGTPAAVRFLSCEPLLGPVDLRAFPPLCFQPMPVEVQRQAREIFPHGLPPGSLNEEFEKKTIDWMIVGGESGPGARPMRLKWARDLVEQCKSAGVPAFFKQAGSKPQRIAGDKFGGSVPGYPDGALVTLKVSGKGGEISELPGGPSAWPREFPKSAARSAPETESES